ncbi:hypothetical protein DL93DRAFT_2169202 [Clavulina sp. PMI_390]|nr:hypothetical protein DL93DRAFT_2169202 [Clavulina sp. PMI_390]
MPRLVPRLKQALKNPDKDFLMRVGGTPARSPHHVRPSHDALVAGQLLERPKPNLSAKRQKSILLDAVNPITQPKTFKMKKIHARTADGIPGKLDKQPALTALECQKHQMLSSPLRYCMLSAKHYHSDFLLRLSTSSMQDDHGKSRIFLLPDGLEHPKYRSLNVTRGSYIILWKDALEEFIEAGTHRRIHPSVEVHSLISEQIQTQLERRLVQECELLLGQYLALPRELRAVESSPLVRALTDAELEQLDKGPQFLNEPAPVAVVNFSPSEASQAVATFMPLAPSPPPEFDLHDSILSPHEVPIYRTDRFISPETRSTVQEALQSLTGSPSPSSTSPVPQAFLIRSPTALWDHKIYAAPIAIALWRLRLWHGEGWLTPPAHVP